MQATDEQLEQEQIEYLEREAEARAEELVEIGRLEGAAERDARTLERAGRQAEADVARRAWGRLQNLAWDRAMQAGEALGRARREAGEAQAAREQARAEEQRALNEQPELCRVVLWSDAPVPGVGQGDDGDDGPAEDWQTCERCGETYLGLPGQCGPCNAGGD